MRCGNAPELRVALPSTGRPVGIDKAPDVGDGSQQLSRCFVLQQDMNASATVTVRALVIRTMSIPDVVEWSASDKSLRKQGPYSKDVWGRVRVRAKSVGGRPVFAERRSRWTSTKCAGPACSDACSARRSRRPREIDPRA